MAELSKTTSTAKQLDSKPSSAGSAPAEGVAHHGDDLTRGCSAKTQRKFAEVLANIRFDRIAPLLQNIRAHFECAGADDQPISRLTDGVADIKISPEGTHTCTVVHPPFNGFYNLVWRVNFSDGASWALKIPCRGHEGEWSDLAAHTLTTEARVMQLLKRETTIPVPDVYAYDAAVDNALGCPFIVMTWIDAVSLDNYWDVNAPFPERLNLHQKVQVLQDLAAAVVQLDKFRFAACGMPLFDETGKIRAVGPAVFTECDEGGHAPPLVEAGPFEEVQHFLDWKIDRFAKHTSDEFEREFVASFRLFTTWVQEATKQPESFVLAHRDLGPQNILVNEEGRMCGIIDWEMAAILPECLGNGKNGSYPHWLTRDYDMFRGHGSSASTANTWAAESALFDPEGELMRLDPLHDYLEHFSSARDTLFAMSDQGDDINTEELEFYRKVWKLCVEQASLNASTEASDGTSMTVDDILARVPRAYATGLTPAQSLDGRILMKAAEYPNQNLETVVTSIKRQIAKVKLSHDLRAYEADDEPQDNPMALDDNVQCAYAEDGLPAMAIAIPSAGEISTQQTSASEVCHVVVPEYMTPPYSLNESFTIPPMIAMPLTPPHSLSTVADMPFTLDGSTIGSTIGTEMATQASSTSSPSLVAAQDVADEGVFHMDDCLSALDTEQGGVAGIEGRDGKEEAAIAKELKAEELELKPWFLYLYAGIPPSSHTAAT